MVKIEIQTSFLHLVHLCGCALLIIQIRPQADEAYLIGEAPSAESYLKMETIIDVAKLSGAKVRLSLLMNFLFRLSRYRQLTLLHSTTKKSGGHSSWLWIFIGERHFCG